MKTLRFDYDSWHYRFTSRFTQIGYHQKPIDLCSYVRAFFAATLFATLLATLATCVAFALVHVVLGIGFSLFYGLFIFSELAYGTMIFIGGCLIYAAIYFTVGWIRKRRNLALYNEKPDGFVVNAYKSWKDKFCVRVEFTHASEPDEESENN